jgi:hypothetical protein
MTIFKQIHSPALLFAFRSVQTNDGLVHISYTFTERVTIKPNQGRENIMHVVIDARAILN